MQVGKTRSFLERLTCKERMDESDQMLELVVELVRTAKYRESADSIARAWITPGPLAARHPHFERHQHLPELAHDDTVAPRDR